MNRYEYIDQLDNNETTYFSNTDSRHRKELRRNVN